VDGRGLFDRLDLPELDEMTKGSATMALEVEPPFDNYVFIEKRRSRSSALARLKDQFPTRGIVVLEEDANEAIQRICRGNDWRFNRAVLFLDPYGMQVSWDTLRAAAVTKAMDVWVLYPSGMGMNRMLTKRGEIPPKWQDTLDRFLGCTEWRTHFYRMEETTDLFGEVTTAVVKEGGTQRFEAVLPESIANYLHRCHP
jgi:three-Cys-motif partner protein